jgi:site-specific recombinase XerD
MLTSGSHRNSESRPCDPHVPGGLRISEALALYPKDIDLRGGSVRVLHGKGNKARTVGLDPGSMAIIERWLQERRAREFGGRQPLICTLSGGPVHPTYVRALLRRLASRAGIEKRVHPHGLRHAHAAELAAEGFPVNLIQKQLGHSSLAVTSRYLDHIAPAEVVSLIQGREWDMDPG